MCVGEGLTQAFRGTLAALPGADARVDCLTPGPPLPVPYPNVAINTDLMLGTTTVNADGGNMIAIRGSQLARSTGDEPGVNGGVTSLVNMRETNWLTYSMDVFMENGNACRLSDKQTHNHYNTVNLNGQFEPLSPAAAADPRIRFLCEILCICLQSPEYSAGTNQYQQCVENMLQANAKGKDTPGYRGEHYPEITPEQGYDPPQGEGGKPTPRSDGKTGYRAPDSIVKKDPSKPATQDNIEYLVEMKFQRFGYCDKESKKQQDRDMVVTGCQVDKHNAARLAVKPGHRRRHVAGFTILR